jgi:hypothetical protein
MLYEKKSIFYVIEQLANCNFDPEFFESFEEEILQKFNQEFNTEIKLKKKSWKVIFKNIMP